MLSSRKKHLTHAMTQRVPRASVTRMTPHLPARAAVVLAAVLLAACVRTPAVRPAPAPLPPADGETAAPVTAPGELAAPVDHDYLRSRDLMVPVAGVSPERIPDTFNAARSGARVHRATDILAPRGTPVLAADDGRVLRKSRSALGGLVVYATDPSGRFVYYYAHLERWAAGLAEGTKLAKGMVIGYVGTSGNAPRNTPHLHFQVMRRDPDKGYWEGTPVDVRPFLTELGQKR